MKAGWHGPLAGGGPLGREARVREGRHGWGGGGDRPDVLRGLGERAPVEDGLPAPLARPAAGGGGGGGRSGSRDG
jgi:hypothetical protein